MVCPKCKETLRETPIYSDPTLFVFRRGFDCESCKWRGWVSLTVEEVEDETYNDNHVQIGLDRLWEQSHTEPLRQAFGARLSYLLNALDRLAGEI